MVFVVGETFFVVGGAAFAMDGAVSMQNRQPAACQPTPSLRFRCIWIKRLLQGTLALYTRAV